MTPKASGDPDPCAEQALFYLTSYSIQGITGDVAFLSKPPIMSCTKKWVVTVVVQECSTTKSLLLRRSSVCPVASCIISLYGNGAHKALRIAYAASDRHTDRDHQFDKSSCFFGWI